jgi:nitrate reductase delta subunit
MKTKIASWYRLISELLMHPDDRDRKTVKLGVRSLNDAPEKLGGLIRSFVGHPGADSFDEYVETIELSGPCPLYMGSYLFEEPKSCRGAGTSGRNGYMIKLANMYRHFGLDAGKKELPDYLPLMVEFQRLSLDRQASNGVALRRYYLEELVLPGFEPFLKALNKYKSPYALLVEALEIVVRLDIERIADTPAWKPPPEPVSTDGSPEPTGSPVQLRFADTK